MNTPVQAIIAGHGQMGHAFEALLRERIGFHIWDVAPDRVRLPPDLTEAAHKTSYLFLCVPTVAHAALLDALSGVLTPDAALISIAKGLDDEGHTAADILHRRLGMRPWGVLGGPMIADEIVAGRVGFAELGTLDAALPGRLDALFTPQRLRIRLAPSAHAVSWCGVLKNIYAPLVGVADGLGWGDNARGHIIMAALAEMRSLLAGFAGESADAYGDAGLADFVTTVTSASSHHYALGRQVARGELVLPECEGLHSLRVLESQRRVDRARHPLYAAVARLLDTPAEVPRSLRAWLEGTT